MSNGNLVHMVNVTAPPAVLEHLYLMTREDEGDFHLRISYAEAFRVTGALGSPSRLD